jgi:putative imidazole glycerol phosphate synthase subunit hisF|uniref:DUF3837 domain-containing protein n=1 Tax=Roseburia sp. TaxID=2049040 RepID=UPI003FEE0CC7
MERKIWKEAEGKSMVTSIARQSVIIKCNMKKSVLTGNYEFYYAAGLVSKLSGISIDDEIHPAELLELLTKEIPGLTPSDEKEAYLFQMILNYRPSEEWDEQMKELLLWGKSEQYLWTVTLPN